MLMYKVSTDKAKVILIARMGRLYYSQVKGLGNCTSSFASLFCINSRYVLATNIYKRDSFGLRNTKKRSMIYRQSETYSHKMPQKLNTTACFIQEKSSSGRPPEDSSWMKQAVVVSF